MALTCAVGRSVWGYTLQPKADVQWTATLWGLGLRGLGFSVQSVACYMYIYISRKNMGSPIVECALLGKMLEGSVAWGIISKQVPPFGVHVL